MFALTKNKVEIFRSDNAQACLLKIIEEEDGDESLTAVGAFLKGYEIVKANTSRMKSPEAMSIDLARIKEVVQLCDDGEITYSDMFDRVHQIAEEHQ